MKYLAAAALSAVLLFSSACTQSPQKLVEAGNRYHDKKKYKEASILYQKAISKDKTNAEAYYREGLNLLDTHDLTGAASYLRRAVDLNPSNDDAATKLAEIYLTAHARDPVKFKQLMPDIADLIAKIKKYHPDSFSGTRLEGLYDISLKDYERALQAFTKANQMRPYSPEIVVPYAETLYTENHKDEAIALARGMIDRNKKFGPAYDFLFLVYTAEKDKDKAKAILEERVKNDPSNEVAIVNLAKFQVAENDYAGGEATVRRLLADPSAFPNRFEIVGSFYLGNKKFDQAIQEFQEGIKQDPKKTLAYNEHIVATYQAMNRPDDAMNLARTLAKQNPKDLGINEIYAGMLLQRGTPQSVQQSLTELKSLVQNNPSDPILHLNLSRAYFDTNDKDKALAEAQEALNDETKAAQNASPPRQVRPDLITDARIVIGRIYEDRGDHVKALEQASLILQTPRGANNPDARLIKDRAMIGIGQGDQALPDLQTLVQQFPQMAGARLELANYLLAKGQFDEAKAQYLEFTKEYPNDLRGPVGLQNVKLAQGKGDEAISGLQDLLKQYPNNLQLRYQLATFEATAGTQVAAKDRNRAIQLFQSAENDYKQILKTTVNSPDIWLRLGVLQRELGEQDAALASFQSASNADPKNSSALLQEAMLQEDLGKKKEAIATYNKVLGIDPDNPLAMNNLAFLSAQDGNNLDQAMTYAEKAKRRFPNSPDISDTLGYVYYQKHQNTEALQIFKDLVATHQDNPTFLFHFALALEKSGDRGAARDEARKALQLSKVPQQQDQIKSFLGQLG